MAVKVWRHVPGKVLMFLLNIFNSIALIYEGYNQGVLGTVSGTPGFIDMAKIGSDGVVTDTTKQGGLTAAYYLGAIVGCLLGGPLLEIFSICPGLTICRLDWRLHRTEERRRDWSSF
jgi:hypothetical protein